MYNDKAHVTMKPMTRELKIPKESKVIGVVGDNEGERVNIDIPRWYDGIDLGSKSIYIVVSNDAAESDTVIPDVEKDEEQLHITWVVQGKHVANEGSVYAHIRATDENGFVWQSFDGEFEVMATQEGPEVMPDAQITAVNQKLQEIDTAKQQALSAAQDALAAATQIAPPIVADAQGNVIAIEDSADRQVKKLTIYGKTTQDGTPTPSASVALQSVGADGNVKVVTAGRNLAALTPKTESYGGVTSSYNPETGEIKLTGTASGAAFLSYWLKEFIPAGITLVYSFSNEIADGNVAIRVQSASEGGNTTIGTLGNVNKVAMVKLTHAAEYITIRVENGHTVDMTIKVNIVATSDTSDTKYTAPSEPQAAIVSTPNGLPGVPVTSGGNYTDANGQQWIADSIEYDADDKIENYVQRIKQAVFNGSETWIASSTNTTGKMRFRCAVSDIIAPENASVVGSVMCDHYKATTENLTYTGNVGIAIGAWGGSVVVFVCDDRYSDVNEWKANLSANPIKCQFALSAPIETALSAEEAAALASLRTHYPVTTIYNDEGAHMAVGYVADTKNYIDRKIRSIAAAMINNI